MQKSFTNLISYVRKISSSLAAQRLWGPSGFLWPQFILLRLSPLSCVSEEDWELLNTRKTCHGVGREDFQFPGTVWTNWTEHLTPLCWTALRITFRDPELTEEGLCFWQWYFTTFTKNSGEKRGQKSQSHLISDATATIGKTITIKAMGTPEKLPCSAKC